MADKSTKGLQELRDNFLQEVLGVTAETADRILRIIKEKGEFSSVNAHMRKLPGEIFNRVFRDVEKAKEHSKKEDDKDSTKKDEKKEDVKESMFELEENFTTDLGKLNKVIQSVKTKEQLKSAEKYADLAFAKVKKEEKGSFSEKSMKKVFGMLNDIKKDLKAKKKEIMSETVKTHSFGSFLKTINEMGDDPRPGDVAADLTRADAEMLSSKGRQAQKKQIRDPKKKLQLKREQEATTVQQKLAAENKRHQEKIKEIKAAANAARNAGV